jgi:hypothetical protein
MMQHQPQLTLLQYNAQAMFHQNKTQEFMEDNFQPEDHQFICEMARKADSQRQEENRKRMLVKHNEAKIQKRQAALETKKRNALQKAGRIAAVTLIFDKEEVAKLKGEKLKDHLLAFKQAGAPGLQGITARSTVGQIRQALQSAMTGRIYRNKVSSTFCNACIIMPKVFCKIVCSLHIV